MNSYKANIINSVALISIGVWGYFEVSSLTALIPVLFGVVLLLCSSGVNDKNKFIAHIVVILTLIILLALIIMRLPKSFDTGGLGLIRVLIMISTSLLSMIYFIKSFKVNRKKTNINI